MRVVSFGFVPSGVTEAAEQVDAGGKFEHVKVTAPWNPDWGLIVSVNLPVSPALIVWGVVADVNPKSWPVPDKATV